MKTLSRSPSWLATSGMSEPKASTQTPKQSEWQTLSPEIIFRVTAYLPWPEIGRLRWLNRHWRNSVDDSIRSARVSALHSIPTELLLKFRRLENLSFENMNEISVKELKPLQNISSLQILTLQGMRIVSDCITAIASCQQLNQLLLIDMIFPKTCYEALMSLSQLTQLTLLKMMYIDVERVEYAGNQCVEMVSNLHNLRVLDMRFDMQAEFLHKVSTLTSLESLCISSNTLSIPNLDFLRPLKQLTQLRLPWTHFSSYEAEQLDALMNITLLDIGATDVTDESLQNFSRLTNLRHLILKDDFITDTALEHISTLTDLVSLDISHGAGLSDVCSLRSISELQSLKKLDLNGTHIEDCDLMLLTQLTNLEALDLGLTDVTEAGIHHLSNITSLKKINTEIARNHSGHF